MLQLRTLGGLHLYGPAGELLRGRRKELVLLVWLAQRSPRPVPRAQLADLLWGERDEKRARHSLRQALLALRRAIGEGLDIEQETVALRTGLVDLDLAAFDAAVEQGRYREAVELWAGDFLFESEDAGGEAFRLWLESERERTRRRLAEAFERLIAEAGSADRSGAIALAERWRELLPMDERAWHRLVELLYVDGRAEAARAHHAEYVIRLKRELDLEPTPAFIELGRRIERLDSRVVGADPQGKSAALRAPAMVGRHAASAELRNAWRTVVEGGSAIVLVEAGQGMGKTRLCDEFLRSPDTNASLQLLLAARGESDTRNSPWAATREMLAGLAGAPGLGGAADADLAEIATLVPAVRGRWPHLPDPSRDEGAMRRAAVRVITAVAEEIPVLVFVDDLGDTDAETQRLIEELARQRPPFVLLLTSIDVDAGGDAIGNGLPNLPAVRRLKLQPLTPSELEMLLGSIIELSAIERRSLAARLHAETGGNPFFAAEIVAAMVDRGHLVLDGRGDWRIRSSAANEALPLPDSVRKVIWKRIDRLTDAARQLAYSAVEFDAPFEILELESTGALSGASFHAALDELLAHRILRRSATGPDALEFAQPMIRRAARARSRAVDSPAGRKGWRRLVPVGLAAIVIASAVALLFALARPGNGRPPTFAVAQFDAANDADDLTAAVLTDMLATNLARLTRLNVISNARMLELEGQLGHLRDAGSSAAAAMHAGAEELIEGGVLHQTDGRLRLELRRVDLRTGEVFRADTIEAADAFELADSATSRLAREFDEAAVDPGIADVMTSSLRAYRSYVDGLRTLARDPQRALRSFEAALAEDSRFAMAAFLSAMTAQHLGSPVAMTMYVRLDSLAAHAPHRERLVVQGVARNALHDPAYYAAAETLATRYPNEPAGHLLLGKARSEDGDFLGAIPPLQRVIAMDSLGVPRVSVFRWGMQGVAELTNTYTLADSFPAAERVAREWVRVQPRDHNAWSWLGVLLAGQGRIAEGLAALSTASAASQPNAPNDVMFTQDLNIRRGEFARADSVLENIVRTDTSDLRRRALWFLIISQRTQGRLRDGLASTIDLVRSAPSDLGAQLLRAQILFESGRFREAIHVFDSIAAFPPAQAIGGILARHKSWLLVHLATTHAAAGDMAALRAVIDPLRAWGARSAYGRDRRLHHHANGLLLAAQGRLEEAAAEFRKAIYSTTFGYTRSNFDLARALLALGRPEEAVAVLEPALRGTLDASNLYVTRTELQALLGRAHDAAGRPDSAAVHYRAVLNAWRNADPIFHARRDSIRVRLATLDSSRFTPATSAR
jgi:DNA-binding SARP family transcriptional activator/TolB-like protein